MCGQTATNKLHLWGNTPSSTIRQTPELIFNSIIKPIKTVWGGLNTVIFSSFITFMGYKGRWVKKGNFKGTFTKFKALKGFFFHRTSSTPTYFILRLGFSLSLAIKIKQWLGLWSGLQKLQIISENQFIWKHQKNWTNVSILNLYSGTFPDFLWHSAQSQGEKSIGHLWQTKLKFMENCPRTRRQRVNHRERGQRATWSCRGANFSHSINHYKHI